MLYYTKSVIHKFKELTGKEYHEWKSILLGKQHNDRLEAYQFMIDNGLKSHIDFMLWTCRSNLKYLNPSNKPIPGEEAQKEFIKDIALDIQESKSKKDYEVEIYNNGEYLKIAWWSLAMDDEDELIIKIYKKDFVPLAKALEVDVSHITSAISTKFPGRNCIGEIASFLKSNKIGFDYFRH